MTARLIVTGAAAGVVGSLVMTAIRAGGRPVGLGTDTPPRQIERNLETRAGVAPATGPAEEAALAFGLHLLTGAAFGALYGAMRAIARPGGSLAGLLYGAAVYAFALAGAGPALRLMPALPEQRPTFAARELITHLAFGTVVAALVERGRSQ
jgi:hypothetical protein